MPRPIGLSPSFAYPLFLEGQSPRFEIAESVRHLAKRVHVLSTVDYLEFVEQTKMGIMPWLLVSSRGKMINDHLVAGQILVNDYGTEGDWGVQELLAMEEVYRLSVLEQGFLKSNPVREDGYIDPHFLEQSARRVGLQEAWRIARERAANNPSEAGLPALYAKHNVGKAEELVETTQGPALIFDTMAVLCETAKNQIALMRQCYGDLLDLEKRREAG